MSLEKKIAAGLGVVLVLLFGIGLVSYWNTTDLIGREARVAQTHHVRETIERLLYMMEDAEDKQRLDLLTGEHQYLQYYREASHNIEEVLHDLTDLTRDSQNQQEQLLALRRLIDLRFAQLKEAIELRDSGSIDANEQIVRLHTGKETMDKILMMLGKMREQEQVLLTNWSRQADSAAAFTLSFVVGGTFLTIVFAIVGGRLIFYDLSRRRQAERDVLAGRAREALILRTMPVVMYSAKPAEDYGALWVSENIEALTGYSPRCFVDDSSLWASRLHLDDQEKTLKGFEMLPHDGALAMEYRWQTRSGEYRWFRDEAVLIRRSDGTPQEIVGLWTDVTARRQASEMMQRQADIIEQIQEAVISLDMAGHVMSWNRGAEKMLGYSVKEVLGKHISFIYPEEDREYLEREILGPVKAKGTHQVEVCRRTKSGALSFAQLALTLLRDNTGSPIGIIKYSMDITDRKRVQEALLNSRNQLAALAVRLESVREEERTRIAMEVHDVLGQALTGLKLDVAWVHKRITESSDSAWHAAVLTRLDSARELLDSTIQSVRDIATTLRPGVLDEIGLEAAVEWQGREFQHRTGIACNTTIRPRNMALSPEQSTALFRILQEILTNVARHAQATNVQIRLEQSGEHVSLQVRDDGRGITGVEQSGPRAFGLLGMRLRAQQQGGTFDIQGTAGTGTTVTVSIPLYRTTDD
ncbi:MAG: PAS domain S-box protein [Nitrospirae bacterium]|nr:PAS domain S-box protein [Nitrospirota bacterium]